eukprot:1154746-Pelagomonas_calceolata.AAC.2
MQAVVLRLESEASEAREVARSEAARREASAAAQSAAALKDAKKTEAKWVCVKLSDRSKSLHWNRAACIHGS